MRVSRCAVAVVMLARVAAGAAQSRAEAPPAATLELRAPGPGLGSGASEPAIPLRAERLPMMQTPGGAAPPSVGVQGHPFVVNPGGTDAKTADALKMAQDKGVCYTIRSYNFTSEKMLPESTRLKDSTTCQPSTATQLKNTSRLRSIVVR